MSTMRVTIVLEFHDVEPGTDRDETIVDLLTGSCDSIMADFKADGCWVDNAEFISTADEA